MGTISLRRTWDAKELQQVAYVMTVLLEEDPLLPMLEAVLLAQRILPVSRQEVINNWFSVEKRLKPYLKEAGEMLRRRPYALKRKVDVWLQTPNKEVDASHKLRPAAVEGPLQMPSEISPTLAKGKSSESLRAAVVATLVQESERVHPTPAEGAALEGPTELDEKKLLTLLTRPAVQKTLKRLIEARIELAMKKASAERGDSKPASSELAPSGNRVLVAGFSLQVSKQLEEVLLPYYDVRVWRSNQSQAVFETIAEGCQLAILPESITENVDEFLTSKGLKVIRHEGGSSARLVERVLQLLGTDDKKAP